jgi:hypothetical protein
VRSFQLAGHGDRLDAPLAFADGAPGDDSRIDTASVAAADLVEHRAFVAGADEQPFAQPLAVEHRVGRFRFQHLEQQHAGYGNVRHRNIEHRNIWGDDAGHRLAEQHYPRFQAQCLAVWFLRDAVRFGYGAVWFLHAVSSRQDLTQSQPIAIWLGRIAV